MNFPFPFSQSPIHCPFLGEVKIDTFPKIINKINTIQFRYFDDNTPKSTAFYFQNANQFFIATRFLDNTYYSKLIMKFKIVNNILF